MTRILITGASGHLGSVVARHASAAGHDVHGTQGSPGGAWHRLDVSRRQAVLDLFAAVDPDVVIHTAAGRRMDDVAVVAHGTGHVAEAARKNGARLVHVSTDAVFAGDRGPYDESAAPCPVNAYGRAKALAEQQLSPADLLVRISLVLGDGSKHERLVHDPGAVHYTDALRSPAHVEDLAEALVSLAGTGLSGVVHLAGADDLSRYEMARLIAERDGLDPGAVKGDVAAQPYPTDTRLRSTRWPVLRGAREFLRRP